MKTKLSPAALRLVLEHEVGGGERYYNAALARPTWPGGASGVTIGIGYDLGFTPRERFLADWHAMEDGPRDRLSKVIGFKGRLASDKVASVRDIRIPWAVAWQVFQEHTIPFWIKRTLIAFPGAKDLPDDAFGALVSLVFNRGPALKGKNREEMAKIFHILADGVQAGDLEKIASAIESMCRLWKGRGLDGLLRRRADEAKLIRNAR